MGHVAKNTSSFLNISVFSVLPTSQKRRFQIDPLGSAFFRKAQIFAGPKPRLDVEGRPKRTEKDALSHLSGLIRKLRLCEAGGFA